MLFQTKEFWSQNYNSALKHERSESWKDEYNLSVESWIIKVNPQLYAVTESYKAVETILEQLRPFLIHAKRKEDLRMIQKIISNPHKFW